MKRKKLLKNLEQYFKNIEESTFARISIDDLRTIVNDNDDKPLLSKDAAIYLGISISTLYKYTHEKRIPYYCPTGRKNYFLRKDLDNFLLENRSSSKNELDSKASSYLINSKV